MRIVKIILIGIIVSVFLVGQAYSAPKGNNGKANNGNANNGNTNNGKGQSANANKNNANKVSQAQGKSAVHKRQAKRSNEINRRREERNRSFDRDPSLNKGNSDLAFNDHARRVNNVRRNGKEMKNERVLPALDLINSLNRARWWHNPHDTRGQGNMGKVDMQDPLGHDKDSDRKELYGNNGRPIRVNEEEEPEVVEELPAEEVPVEEEIPEVVEEFPVEEPLPTEDPLPEEPPIEIIALLDPYVDYLLGLIEEAEINNSMYSSTVTYAEYLRGFMDNYIQEHMPTYVKQWTFQVPENLDVSKLAGVDFTEMIDFNTLDDPNIQKMLQEIENAKIEYDYTPTYVIYLEQFMNNYFITNYYEQALQIVEGSSTDPVVVAPLDASVDFSSIDDMQWLVNWYEGAVANYYGNDSVQESYTYEQWESMWYNHFFPEGDLNATTGIRVNNIGDESERYDFDITFNEIEGDSIIVTTTLTSAETGEILYEQTEEVGVDSTTDTVTIGISATDDLISSTSYSAIEYVEMEVVITDSSTGATYTQTYDKSLYLYRCPYGKLTNEVTGQAIVNAKITVHFEDGSIVSLDKATNKTASNPQITDVTGRFGFILQSNRKYYLTATAEGYEDYKSDIFTEQWHVLREDIAMAPKLEQMASNME